MSSFDTYTQCWTDLNGDQLGSLSWSTNSDCVEVYINLDARHVDRLKPSQIKIIWDFFNHLRTIDSSVTMSISTSNCVSDDETDTDQLTEDVICFKLCC